MIHRSSEITGVLLEGRFFVAGGLVNGVVTTDLSQYYDVKTDTWVNISRLPKKRNHVSTASYGGKVYVMGGTSTLRYEGGFYTWSWVYDPATDTWERIAESPGARVAASAVTLGDYIYLAGGLVVDPNAEGPGTYNELLRYHPETDTWDMLAPALEVREHAVSVVLDGKIYMTGGRYGVLMDSVEIYDPETDMWEYGTPMNEPRAAHAAVVLEGKIYLFGGEDIYGTNVRVLDSSSIYDPETDTWSEGPTMPFGIHGLTGFAFGDVIYLVGGSDLPQDVENYGRVLAYRP
jgi:N-acetylneuraminic acid mutarotase